LPWAGIWEGRHAQISRYFFVGANGEAILASRKKRADSSGGVGLI